MEYNYVQCKHENKTEQISLADFVLQHFYWGGLLYLFFMTHLFGRLRLPGAAEPLSAAASQCIFLSIVIICIAAGFLFSLKHNRSRWRIALNVLTPYGVYLMLKTATQNPFYLWAAVLICMGETLLYAVFLFSAPIHHRKNRAVVLKARFHQMLSVAWLLLRTMLCLLAISSVIVAVFGSFVTKPASVTTSVNRTERPGDVEYWKEHLQGLQKEQWASLTLQEKAELMQLVVDIETDYLGLPDVPHVYCSSMLPSTLGSYSHEGRLVCISQDHLLNDPPRECLGTVLHEVYHSYQHHLCALYEDTDDMYRSMLFLREAVDYIDEFENYNCGSEDFMDYYTQACESNARKYAWLRGNEYQYIVDLE